MRLNLDAGELDDEPADLIPLADMVNVACGAHAGDEAIARRAIRRAKAHGVAVGAHPGYPDRANFGRRPMALTLAELRDSISAQLRWLDAIARDEGAAVTHVKPHGALYHGATEAHAVATCVMESTREVLGRVELVGFPFGAMDVFATVGRWPFAREGFADRGYRDDGALVPRGEPGDVIESLDAVRAQVRRLAREGVVSTVCVHGDGARALEVARAVREVLG